MSRFIGIIYIFKKIFWQDKLAASFLFFGFIFNLIDWLVIWWQIKPEQSGVILHYNVFFGIDVISFDLQSRYFQVFLAPLGALAIWLVNFLLGAALWLQASHGQFRESNDGQSVRKQKQKARYFYLDYLDAQKLSGYLLWGGALAVQLIVLVYVVSIVRVNQ